MGLTRKLNATGGQSLWSSRPLKKLRLSRLNSSSTFDVVVVGSGISGALVAESLTERGLSVAIIDRRKPIHGSTPASTALLQYEIDTPLSQLSDQIGKERAQRIWRRSKLAVDALRERTRRLGIEADCVDRNSLYLDGDQLNADVLYDEYLARCEAGFEISHFDRQQVRQRFGIKKRSAIMGYDNMSADPRRLAAGYLRVAMKRGAKLFSPFEIEGVATSTSGVTLETTDGQKLHAGSAVFATGYEWLKGIPKKGHSISSTWVIATKPQPRKLWVERCLIWEASEPYLYMRVTPDNRVICGGGDEDFSDEVARNAMMDQKIEEIRECLSKLLPKLDTRPDFRWCGNFGKSKTGAPTIGPVPHMPNCYAVMGFGGNGITFSMMAAQIVSSMITGFDDPDSELFSFHRKF